MEQKKFSFDKTSLIKIGKGALIAATGGASLALLDYFEALKIDQPVFATIIVILIPVITNAAKEYINGE